MSAALRSLSSRSLTGSFLEHPAPDAQCAHEWRPPPRGPHLLASHPDLGAARGRGKQKPCLAQGSASPTDSALQITTPPKPGGGLRSLSHSLQRFPPPPPSLGSREIATAPHDFRPSATSHLSRSPPPVPTAAAGAAATGTPGSAGPRAPDWRAASGRWSQRRPSSSVWPVTLSQSSQTGSRATESSVSLVLLSGFLAPPPPRPGPAPGPAPPLFSPPPQSRWAPADPQGERGWSSE